LNLTNTNSPGSEDWNIMDYLTAGRYVGENGASAGPEGTAVSLLPVKILNLSTNSTNVRWANTLIAQGGVNMNTRKATTIQAVLSNAPGVTDTAAEVILSTPPGQFASAYGSLAALASLPEPIVASPDTKFGKEAVQRALANIAVNQSRVFTVYALGEYRSGKSYARALLEADVFVGVDPATGTPRLQVINQSYR
jgi:hypothetical protein